MLQEPLLPHFIYVRYKTEFSWKFILLMTVTFTCSSAYSASITTLSSSTYHHFELLSNDSYRKFFLRQYVIDLLNESHSSLIKSMVLDHQLTTRVELIQGRKRKHIDNKQVTSIPRSTVPAVNCSIINGNQVQSTFQWSHSLEMLSSIELIYHIDSIEMKKSVIPIRLSLKHSQTLRELFSLNTYLQIDNIRDFYFLNIYDYVFKRKTQNIIIETSIENHTCQALHAYILVSSLQTKPVLSHGLEKTTTCKLKTIHIGFEELGLAYLIVRPKEYVFTYCDGSCSTLSIQQEIKQYSIYSLIKSIIGKKHSNIPQVHCVPSEFSNDNLLLRQTDGTIEIYPIKNAIVKKCACL